MGLQSIVLLSAGLDSCFALSEALRTTKVISTLTFDYGQVARKAEITQAKRISAYFDLPNKVISIPIYKNLKQNPIINVKKKCPKICISQLDDRPSAQKTAQAVWIPNRNGVFLNIAAAIAETEGMNKIFVGFNREEAKTFSDNSYSYLTSLNKCFKYSTRDSVQVIAPAIRLNKAQILKKLMKYKFPLYLIWSCYRGGRKMCGQCESCLRLKRAITELNIDINLFNF